MDTVDSRRRLLNEKTEKVCIRRDVIFNEVDFGKCAEPDVGSEDPNVIEATREELDKVNQPEAAHQQPTRQIRPLVRYGVDEYVDTASCTLKDDAHHVAYSDSQIREPVTMEEYG